MNSNSQDFLHNVHMDCHMVVQTFIFQTLIAIFTVYLLVLLFSRFFFC